MPFCPQIPKPDAPNTSFPRFHPLVLRYRYCLLSLIMDFHDSLSSIEAVIALLRTD